MTDLHSCRDQHAPLVDGSQPRDVNAGLQNVHQILGRLLRVNADDGDHTAGKEHARQGDDKRLDFKVCDQEPLHQAESKADQQRHQRSEYDAPAFRKAQRSHQIVEETEIPIQNHHADHGNQRHHTADGDVDAAGDHDDGQAA